ncbi:hypothetical protein ABZU32_09840 [Sphaerisporangium sp. NPDC005288]|uniref:hypothetical protein n=1 Tax=Sphaerisporangium sp. NPDC005288 TaxID=3155114 RepID=UPI0033A8A5D1
MTWEAATLVVIAVTGILTLVLTQVRDILLKVDEVLDAWRRVRRTITMLSGQSRAGGGNGGDDTWRKAVGRKERRGSR